MKNLSILLLLSLSLLAMSVQANETETNSTTAVQPIYNTGSDWWAEVTPEDPDYHIYKYVELNCFCN